MGNAVDYDKDRISFLRRHHREYGDVFSFDDRVVFTIDPRLTHQVLTATNRDYVTELAPFAGSSALLGAGEMIDPWMGARRVVRPALADDAVAGMDGRIVAILDAVLDATAGRPVDVLPVMLDFAGQVVADLCFGEDAAGIPELLAANHAALLPFENAGFQLPAWVPSPRNRRFFRVHRRTVETLTRLVAARRAEPARRRHRDLLDVLLGTPYDPRPATTEDPAGPGSSTVSDKSVVTTLWSILIGGHGVPAAALTSMVRELAIRPRLAAALAAEAGASVGAECPADRLPPAGAEGLHARRPLTEAGYPHARLPLAEAVVKEALRLTPPAWMMTRVARTDVALGEWRLGPGDEVLITPYLIHRDPRWWSHPDEFDPSRWDTVRPAPGTYIPFGSGPRYCPGSAAAMRQLTLATSRIAQRFHVHAPNADAAEPEFCGRLAPSGLRAAFLPVDLRADFRPTGLGS
ncbi:cytochrome P450 [Nonomuraea sp. CA-143628]|uniref:cytochrome P450 n=1 Tax=Nonomuraea sp. CA-143628 TaxID=3239997 RepID=UPI003D92F619